MQKNHFKLLVLTVAMLLCGVAVCYAQDEECLCQQYKVSNLSEIENYHNVICQTIDTLTKRTIEIYSGPVGLLYPMDSTVLVCIKEATSDEIDQITNLRVGDFRIECHNNWGDPLAAQTKKERERDGRVSTVCYNITFYQYSNVLFVSYGFGWCSPAEERLELMTCGGGLITLVKSDVDGSWKLQTFQMRGV